MYICNKCNAVFEEPKQVTECLGEFWGQPAYQDFYYCPECGSDAIDEAGEYAEYTDEELIDRYQYLVETLGDTSIIPDVIKQEDIDYIELSGIISEMDKRNIFDDMED